MNNRARAPCGLAKKQGTDLELVLGKWADRTGEDEEWGLERAMIGALRSAINDHGPITADLITSASRRFLANVVSARGPTFRG